MGQQVYVEYVVIAVYFLIMLATAFVFQRYNNKFSDYFRSGSQGTWWLVGSSIFMASFTAWTYTGAVGVAYESGITISLIYLANALGYGLNAVLTARWFRQLRATTYPEVVRARFGTWTQQFYIYVGILPGILMASLTLWGVALFTSAVFGLDQTMLIVGVGVVVLVYSVVGGLWAVMATDFLQALILVPMTVLVAVLSLGAVGGIDGLISEIGAQGHPEMLQLFDRGPEATYTPVWASAFLVFVVISYNSIGSSVKFFSCKDGREASRASALAAVLMLLGSVLWIIPPMVARLRFSEFVDAQPLTKPAEAAYAVVAMRLLPAGMTGMIVVAMFAATMSSLSTIFNQFAGIMTQDVYKPFLRPKASERELFVAGRVATVVVGAAIVAMAVHLSRRSGGALFDSMLLFGSLLGTPMVVPLFLVLFIRRTPPWSAVASVCAGLAASLLAYTMEFGYAATVFSVTGTSTAGYLATMPFWGRTPPEYQRKVAEFHEKMRTPVDFEAEVGSCNDSAQLRLIGRLACVIGGFLFLLIAVPNPLAGRFQIAIVSLCVFAFGCVMVFASRRASGGSDCPQAQAADAHHQDGKELPPCAPNQE
ncbi:MAG: solute:Na+ symporter, family [Candidatus Sumerlaeota bacterium]|nr:solute:Na+ symporter, family [Candidatus Sumerlaeota bacterium]